MSLSRPPGTSSGTQTVLVSESFRATSIGRLRRTVARRAEQAGLTGDRLHDFVLAVYELLTNAVRHGGGSGRLRLASDHRQVVCDVDDDGRGFTAADGGPTDLIRPGGMGWRLARLLTDSVRVASGPRGTSIEVRMALDRRQASMSAC